MCFNPRNHALNEEGEREMEWHRLSKEEKEELARKEREEEWAEKARCSEEEDDGLNAWERTGCDWDCEEDV
jgi:hypothetical protein